MKEYFLTPLLPNQDVAKEADTGTLSDMLSKHAKADWAQIKIDVTDRLNTFIKEQGLQDQASVEDRFKNLSLLVLKATDDALDVIKMASASLGISADIVPTDSPLKPQSKAELKARL